MSVPILVTAFCRPALTLNAISSLVKLRPESEIIISQDGKIPGFYEREHSLTRRALQEVSLKYPQVTLNLRDANFGLTQHLLQILQKLFRANDSLIFLEEDMQICDTGLEFLECIEGDLGLSHRTSFSTNTHPLSNDRLAFRQTYFPEQWGISINRSAFEAFVGESTRKQVDRRSVRKVINQVGYGKIKSELLTDFWIDLLRKEINAPHGWDATLQWALWNNFTPAKVSLENHVVDLGGGAGAITSRGKNENISQRFLGNHSISHNGLCLFCEQQDARRRRFSTLSHLRARIQLRSRLKLYLEMKKYM